MPRISPAATDSCVRDGLLEWDARHGWLPTSAGLAYLDAFLPTVPTRLSIADVMCAHPDLSAEGFDNAASADFIAARARLARATDEFDRAVEWLGQVPRTVTPHQHSYKLKYAAQAWAGAHISHGSLLCAALHMGIKVKRVGGMRCARVAIGGPKGWPK